MDNSQICILCRGSSMDKADKYFHKINGDMIAVNEFNVELKHDFVHRIMKIAYETNVEPYDIKKGTLH